ncbi:neuropeptide FF receptor 2-like [Ruditapes philippinarum]|uniref:neuropeptide FF receptor 2-like n=1 Tax=Ruditapes philippinarum TaxID=129788 RepID=UPI00295C1C09|nr:neuropeptide FF receptor 2-like [Ruditapes philippinarum]
MTNINDTAKRNSLNASSAPDEMYFYYFPQCVPGMVVPKIEVDPYSVSEYDTILPEPIPNYEIALKLIAYIISFLMAIIGNASLIWIIMIDKKLRTPTNALITNLAASDLMVACTCMWIHLGNSITTEWPFGSFICSANQFLQVTAVSSSTVTMAAIALERFLVVIFPLKSKGKIKIKYGLLASWIIAVLNGLPHLFTRRLEELYWANRHEVWCRSDWPQIFTSEKCETAEPLRTIYYTCLTIIMYFLPVFIIAVAYVAIMIKLLTRVAPGESTSSPKDYQKKRKVPDYVMNELNFSAIFLAYFNSAINPILYAGMSTKLRKKYKRFL